MPNLTPFPSSSAVEQLTVNQRVTGSNPVSGANFSSNCVKNGYFTPANQLSSVESTITRAAGLRPNRAPLRGGVAFVVMCRWTSAFRRIR